MSKGLIIVVSAPSGAGKTTICKKVVALNPSIVHSISYSTRKPREGEINGVDYFFVSEKSFFKSRLSREFIEWAKVHGNFYGTPKAFIENSINNGLDVILDIDVVGALKVKKKYPESVLIFILPPNKNELESRLRKRNTEDEENIKKRLNNAEKELKYINNYNYVVKNIDLNEAVDKVKAIIKAEKSNIKRWEKVI
ncbi:guanylate kinase [Candidatus Desantisbacteria bacterium]|nr:guanylate kinase [Candidatus Desantisbacteria bacterium]